MVVAQVRVNVSNAGPRFLSAAALTGVASAAAEVATTTTKAAPARTVVRIDTRFRDRAALPRTDEGADGMRPRDSLEPEVTGMLMYS